MIDFSSVKAGDRVWLGSYSNPKCRIKTVTKTTPTQIVIGNDRYSKIGGYRISGAPNAQNIEDIATAEECAAWDANQERERRELLSQQTKEQEKTAKRTELASLFGDKVVVVSAEVLGEDKERDGRYTVEFHFLTEEQVRKLATAAGIG